MTDRDLKKTAVFLLMLPLLIFGFFAIGEIPSGASGAEIRLVQLSPLILLIFFSWNYPKIAGIILICLGLFLGLLYSLFIVKLPFGAIILAEGLIFVPIIISGIIFVHLSAKK